MYEQNAQWNEYYRELSPERRRRMLGEMSAQDDGANAFRLRLWEARHGGSGGAEVDRFLFQFVSLPQTYYSASVFKKSAAREVEKAMRSLLTEEAVRQGESGERALYWEIRNAAARYFKTCESAGYNRGLFGMPASGDAGRKNRVCRDVWQMTLGLEARTGMKEALRIWNRAVLDEHARFDPDGPALLETYKSKKKK